MQTGFSITELEILLYCYKDAGPHVLTRSDEIMYAVGRLKSIGAITEVPWITSDQVAIKLTKRGRAWVKVVLQTPPPLKKTVIKYFDAEGKEISV